MLKRFATLTHPHTVLSIAVLCCIAIQIKHILTTKCFVTNNKPSVCVGEMEEPSLCDVGYRRAGEPEAGMEYLLLQHSLHYNGGR